MIRSRVAQESTSVAEILGNLLFAICYRLLRAYRGMSAITEPPWLVRLEKVEAVVQRLITVVRPKKIILFGSYETLSFQLAFRILDNFTAVRDGGRRSRDMKLALSSVVGATCIGLFAGCADQPKKSIGVATFGGKVGIEVNGGYVREAPCILTFEQDDGNVTRDISQPQLELLAQAYNDESFFGKHSGC
jgi:hypothetical protein